MANLLASIGGMGIDKILGGIGSLAKDVKEVITGKASPETAARVEMQMAELEREAEILKVKTQELQQNVIIAEAQSESFLTRTWRPALMYTFIIIIFNNYVVAPYLGAFTHFKVMLDVPSDMWSLLTVGVGGYIVSRGAEKGITKWKDKSCQ